MPYLFESWQEILERIRQARQILLFLDYDGTLTPIAEKPESAVLSTHVRGILKRVSQHEKFKLAIISGRSLEDIKALVGLDGITYAGNHGLEIEYLSNDPQNKRQITIRYIHPLAARYRPTIREAGEVLLQGLANIQGVLIEDKGLTLSVHYRLVKPTEVEIVKKLFFQALAPYLNVASISVQPCSCSSRESDKEKKPKTSAPLKVTQGKKVLEVRPLVAWDKGKAIEWLLQVYDH
ncbi:MAG: trehalose-phosphatase, partial [Nitrososphaerota archaeon]